MSEKKFHNFEGIAKSVATVKANWRNFRDDINKGLFSPRDVISASNHVFLKTFDELFGVCNGVADLTKRLDAVNAEYKIMRGAKISNDEYCSAISYDRLMPQKDYIKEDNRFSPKGVEWLYLAISDELSQAKECSIKECRAKGSDKFALVSFVISDKCYTGKIVDLTVGADYDYTELENHLENVAQSNYEKAKQAVLDSVTDKEKRMRNSKREKRIKERTKKEIAKYSPCYRKRLMIFLTLTYSKLISENIFEPVETDKAEKYAPFHCLAQYFISNGYMGIIYSSTVCENGKNLVLFDKSYAYPTGDIGKFIL